MHDHGVPGMNTLSVLLYPLNSKYSRISSFNTRFELDSGGFAAVCNTSSHCYCRYNRRQHSEAYLVIQGVEYFRPQLCLDLIDHSTRLEGGFQHWQGATMVKSGAARQNRYVAGTHHPSVPAWTLPHLLHLRFAPLRYHGLLQRHSSQTATKLAVSIWT